LHWSYIWLQSAVFLVKLEAQMEVLLVLLPSRGNASWMLGVWTVHLSLPIKVVFNYYNTQIYIACNPKPHYYKDVTYNKMLTEQFNESLPICGWWNIVQ
jgi:hypothetical protein